MAWSGIVSKHMSFLLSQTLSMHDKGLPQAICQASTRFVLLSSFVILQSQQWWRSTKEKRPGWNVGLRVVFDPRSSELRVLSGNQVRVRAGIPQEI